VDHQPHSDIRRSANRSPARRPASVFLAATLALATSCRPALSPLLTPHGSTASTQTSPADQFFSAFADRFTNVRRDAKLEAARARLAHGALIPSRVFNDTAAWSTLNSSSVRTLSYRGTFVNGQYRMSGSPAGTLAANTSSAADTRHIVTLTQLGAEEYRWEVVVDHSMGRSGASNIASIFNGLFASAERRTEPTFRTDYRSTLPRTTSTLGRLFAIDSVRTTPRSDGSTLVGLVIRIQPDSLRTKYPLFASYVTKYVSPAVLRAVLRDRSPPASTYFVADIRRNRIDFQFRSRDGRLLPLAGPARTMPDTLELESLVSAKVGIFRVGFEQLRSDFIITHGAQPSWTLRWQREPEWKLPLFTESLIRSSLRRPFQQGGASFRVGLRDDGANTVMFRHGTIAVHEGTILRFLGRLGSRAYSDLSTRVEKEMQDYLRDVFSAMREDARGLTD
jgi:hypothetical protein